MKRTDFKTKSDAPAEKVKYKPNLTYDARALEAATIETRREYCRAIQTSGDVIFCPYFDFETGEIYGTGKINFPIEGVIYLQSETDTARFTARFRRHNLNIIQVLEVREFYPSPAFLTTFKAELKAGRIKPEKDSLWWHKHIHGALNFQITDYLTDVYQFFEDFSNYNYISENDFYNQLNTISYEKE